LPCTREREGSYSVISSIEWFPGSCLLAVAGFGNHLFWVGWTVDTHTHTVSHTQLLAGDSSTGQLQCLGDCMAQQIRWDKLLSQTWWKMDRSTLSGCQGSQCVDLPQ